MHKLCIANEMLFSLKTLIETNFDKNRLRFTRDKRFYLVERFVGEKRFCKR